MSVVSMDNNVSDGSSQWRLDSTLMSNDLEQAGVKDPDLPEQKTPSNLLHKLSAAPISSPRGRDYSWSRARVELRLQPGGVIAFWRGRLHGSPKQRAALSQRSFLISASLTPCLLHSRTWSTLSGK